MKKTVSFCFLSILLFVFGLVPKMAQGQTEDCVNCLWLENQNPNHEFETTTLEPVMEAPRADLYRIYFQDNCDLGPNAKISLEWEIKRNGVLISDEEFHRYAEIEFRTMYTRLGSYLPPPGDERFLVGDVLTSKPQVINGEVRDYPGAIKIIPGVSLGEYSLDFFYLHFFQSTENYIQFNWKQIGEYQVVLRVIERLNGTDYPSFYYDEEQTLNIGGHQSQRGRVLAVDTLKKLIWGDKYDEVCFEDLPYIFGRQKGTAEPFEFNYSDTLLRVDVPFYNIDCPQKIDSAVHLELLAFPELGQPVVESFEICQFSGNVTLEATINQVSRIGDIFVEWRIGLDGEWTQEAPTVSSDVPGVFDFYARYAMYGDIVNCYGEPILLRVTVHELPPHITNPKELFQEFCLVEDEDFVPAPLVITPSEDCEIEWYINGAWTNVAPRPDVWNLGTTYYPIRQKDLNTGCVSDPADTVTVVILPLPEVELTTDATDNTICEFDSITITASGDYLFQWFVGETNLDETLNFIKISPAPGTYTYSVIATDKETGCEKRFEIEIIVNELPRVTIVATPDVICLNQSSTLSGVKDNQDDSYTYTYIWGTPDETNVVTPTEPGDYTYYVTITNDETECSKVDSVEITVLPLPEVSFTYNPDVSLNGNRICSGDSVEITAHAEPNDIMHYNWLIVTEDGPYLDINPINLLPTPSTEIYFIEVTNTQTGCVKLDSVVFYVYSKPTPVIYTQKDQICDGDSTILSLSQVYDTYEWMLDGEIIATTPTLTVKEGGDYSVIVSNANNCTATAYKTIVLLPVPDLNITAIEPICNGDRAVLTVTDQNEVPYEISYVWSYQNKTGDQLITDILINQTGDVIEIPVYVVGTYTTTQCTTEADYLIVVKPAPDATITTSIKNVCAGDQIVLRAKDNRNYTVEMGPYTYLWSENAGSSTIDTVVVNPEVTTDYSVTITNSFGCSHSVTSRITVNPLPTPEIVGNESICEGTDLNTLATNPNTYVNYEWSTGATTPTINAIEAGTYSVTVTDILGCVGGSDDFTVVVNPTPPVTIVGDEVLCSGGTLVLHAVLAEGETLADYEFEWSTGAETSFIELIPAPGTHNYTVTVYNTVTECEVIKTKTVIVKDIPAPNLVITNDNQCVDQPMTLSSTASDLPHLTYNWTVVPNTITIADPTAANITVVPTSSEIFTFILKINDTITGCSNSATKEIDVRELPIYTLRNSVEYLCAGDRVWIGIDYADDNYKYLWSTSDNDTIERVWVNPTTTTTYYVKITTRDLVYNCAIDDSVKVIVREDPVFTFDPVNMICADECVTVSVTENELYKYEWSTGTSNGNETVICPPATQRVYVTVSYPEIPVHCHVVDSIDIEEFTIDIDPIILCLNAPQLVFIKNPVNGVVYTWASDTGVMGQGTSMNFFETEALGYTITVTGTIDDCTSPEFEFEVTVRNLPGITHNTDPIEVCVGSEVTLTAPATPDGAGQDYTYLWEDGTDEQSITVTVLEDHIYTCVVADEFCTSTLTFDVKAIALPSIWYEFIENDTVCNDEKLTIIPYPTVPGTEYEYIWLETNSGPILYTTGQNTGLGDRVVYYGIVVTDPVHSLHCVLYDSAKVVVKPSPSPIINATATTLCYDGVATLDAGDGFAHYLWSNGEEGQTIEVHGADGTTTYSVNVTDEVGCKGDGEIVITVETKPELELGFESDEICPNELLTIEATSGLAYNYSYAWTPNNSSHVSPSVYQSRQFPNNTPDPLYTTISVTITDHSTSLNCTVTESVEITINPKPIAAIVTDSLVCLGETIELVARDNNNLPSNPNYGVSTFFWYEGVPVEYQTDDTIYYTPTEFGTKRFAMTATNSYGCTHATEANIKVDTITTIKLTNEFACYGEAVTVELNAIYSKIIWRNSEGDSIGNGQSIELYVDDQNFDNNEYSVDVVTGNCSASAEFTIRQFDEVTGVLPYTEGDVCSNEVPLTVNAGDGFTSYSWTFNGVEISDEQTAELSTEGEYTVNVVDENQCPGTATYTLTVNQAPVVTITPDDPSVCVGALLTLTASGDGVDTYVWNGNAQITGNTISHTFTTDQVGEHIYTVAGVDDNDCWGFDTVTVTVKGLPVTTNRNLTACADATQMDIYFGVPEGAEYGYEWDYDGLTDATINVELDVTEDQEVFWATIELDECFIRDSVVVTKAPLAEIDLDLNLTTAAYCFGTDVILTTGIFDNVGVTYEITMGDVQLDFDEPNVDQITIGVDEYVESGDYTIVVRAYNTVDSEGNYCWNSAQIDFTVNPLPEIEIENNSPVCFGDDIKLSASGADISGYIWESDVLTVDATGQTLTVPVSVYQNANTYTFTLTGTDNNGCTTTVEDISVVVNPLPNADISLNNNEYCAYETIEASVVLIEGNIYEWSHSGGTSNQATFDIEELGIVNNESISVTVTDANGCVNVGTATIIVNATPTTVLEDLGRFCEGTTGIQFEVPYTVGYSYKWNDDEFGIVATYPVTVTQTVTLTVKDNSTGCTRTSEGSVIFDDRPYIDITTYANESDIIFDLDGTTGTMLHYDVIVRNNCQFESDIKVILDYTISRLDEETGEYVVITYEDGNGIHNRMTGYVSNEYSMKYYMNAKDGDNTNYSPTPTHTYSYYDRNSDGFIPGGEERTPTGAEINWMFYIASTHDSYEWLYLHYLVDRRVTVEYNSFTIPGEYKAEYFLTIVNGDGHNQFPYDYSGHKIGGNNYQSSIEVLASRTIYLHVGGEVLAPDQNQPSPPQPIVSEVTAPATTLKAYPNPITKSDELKLEVKNAQAGMATVTIFDNRGIQIETFKTELQDGTTIINHYLQANYSEGFYYVRVLSGKAVLTDKIVIVK